MQDKPKQLNSTTPRQLSRRNFLTALSALLTGGLLAGCDTLEREKMALETNRWGTPTRTHVMASPQPLSPTGATPPAEGELSVEQFLALSRALTGFEDLEPALAQVYLDSLQASPDLPISLAALYEHAHFDTDSPPQNIDQLVEAGLFDNQDTRTLADTITEYWYTGVYKDAEGNDAIATTADALAWQSLNFTKPPTVCGPYTGFWAERPIAAPMPPVHEAALPDKQSNSN